MADKLTLEKKIEKLDKIVDQIENENLPLDKAITLFEEGSKLIKEVQTELNEAEKKIAEVTEVDRKAKN